ncbi:TPA: hypothetical protein U2B49_001696 [Streptococcus suis]|nr:hypothetical protein [Streptococcus suis]NQJ20270.1 hypothetical protein [Streptococcus suis]NQK58288.1 hypothetical protein [Streptococcus suis]NQN96695.1 hypothetical protein [Streptococcus suis]NQO33340.1 hypothetical protein [Streptococcus suis]
MTEQEFFEQADKELEELNQRRANYMADDTPVEVADIPKLLKIGAMLRNEDTSLNAYELYKHPEARAKLFAQITEACYMVIGQTPSQSEKLNFGQYLEGQFQAIVKKLISQTDTQALGELVAALDLDDKLASQFIRDIAVSGLLGKDNQKQTN